MALVDSPVIQRIAQLHHWKKTRGLNPNQEKELEQCLDWLVNHCYKQALLRNYSLLASMTNDLEWQHQICKEIDEG